MVIPPKKKVWLPAKLTISNSIIEINYLDGTALISSIKYANGTSYSLSYTDKILKKLVKQLNNTIIQSADYLVADGKITRVQRFNISGQRSTPTEKYYFLYNTKSELVNVKTYEVSNLLQSELNLAYNSAGNISSAALKTGSITENFEYTYDASNSLFKDVLIPQILRFEINELFLNQGTNNLTRINNTSRSEDEISYQYIYNADNYPTEIKYTNKGVVGTYKVSYIELK